MPCQDSQNQQRQHGYSQGKPALEPNLRFIEGIAVGPLCQIRQGIVAPLPHRSKYAAGNAAIGTVGSKQFGQDSASQCQGSHKQHQHGVAQPVLGRRICVAVLLGLLAQPCKYVLHDTKRADYRTVHAPKKQRQHHKQCNHNSVHSQNRWQELNLCHPPKPLMDSAGKVQKQGRNKQEECRCQANSQFS